MVLEVITDIWAHDDGTRLAVQLDEETIIVTDYATDPPTHTEVFSLEEDGWTETLVSGE